MECLVDLMKLKEMKVYKLNKINLLKVSLKIKNYCN